MMIGGTVWTTYSADDRQDGKWQMHHGDTILLNLSKAGTCQLIFRAG